MVARAGAGNGGDGFTVMPTPHSCTVVVDAGRQIHSQAPNGTLKTGEFFFNDVAVLYPCIRGVTCGASQAGESVPRTRWLLWMGIQAPQIPDGGFPPPPTDERAEADCGSVFDRGQEKPAAG